MNFPVHIQFRHLSPSAAVESRISKEAAKLQRVFERIINCRVVVGAPDGHHENGGRYHITINVAVPGSDIVIAHEPALHGSTERQNGDCAGKSNEPAAEHKDIYVSIRDAFAAARRRLKEYARELRPV
jgi:ribosome-associated translation inhibitor RaiA